MSFGEFLFVALLVVPFTLAVLGALVLSVIAIVGTIGMLLESMGVTWEQAAGAVVVTAFLLLFAWFVLDCPGCSEPTVPHAVEGREEWIDLREGTTYSQVERRTDD